MVEKIVTPARDVIDFESYRARIRAVAPPMAVQQRLCSHCGALMFEDESEDECSSLDAGVGYRFRATGV
jgi:hypothetical protein